MKQLSPYLLLLTIALAGCGGGSSSGSGSGSDGGPGDSPDGDSGADPIVPDVLEVPSSYSVSDAARYHIPKAERVPGRLGGPPPLNLPGGPSDPNR